MSPMITDELWTIIQPILPRHTPSRKGGRPRKDDRQCLEGIVYVLRGGIPWKLFPDLQFSVSGVTCWRRLSEWTQAGVWPAVHRKLLDILGKAGKIDLSAAVIDSASVRALFGGATADPIPRIARKKGANAT